MKISPGFIVYDTHENGASKYGTEITWVTPHSGASLETPTSRDSNCDTVASLCWLKVGGRLVVSTMPRKRALGIDLNRDPSPLGKSLKYYPLFMKNSYPKKLEEYRKKYAWCAEDKRDHNRRLGIYKNFWSAVKQSGRTVVFVHTMYTRPKNFPSIIDVVAYEDYGFSKKILSSVVRKLNRKYEGFFDEISDNYKNTMILEEKRVLERIMEIYGSIDPRDMGIEYKKHILADLKIIKRHADQKKIDRLEKNFTIRNFMSAVKSALHNSGSPKITIESIFRGEGAREEAKRISRKKNVVSIESTTFINYWYPNEAAEIILDIVNEIKPMRKITNYLSEKG